LIRPGTMLVMVATF